MKQDIRLFIGSREVEFNATPQILYNYTETDLHNPTTVKNSFTKTIDIEGTKNNNDVFGQYWNLERFQDYGGQTGPAFNPMVKTDFSLFVGGALYEKGYCKLNNISVEKSGNIKYSITLYGGLGSFFSRLTYQTETDDNAKLTLADLDYNYVEDGIESTLQEWAINKDEIWNAWGTICSYGDTNSARYRLIQYVPTYDGVPENFDAEKCLINCYDFPGSILHTVGYDDYKPVYNGVPVAYGYALGEYSGELTPWTAFDLRSYLMRPAVRMKYIIDACGNPAINGGYELDLDSHFFNNNNPYYNDSWITLGSIPSLNLPQTSGQTITGGATLSRQSGSRSGDLFNVTYTGGTISRISNAKLRLRVGFTPSDSTSVTTLYTDTDYTYVINQWDTQKYISAGGCIVQLWAMDGNDNIVGSSNAYLLSSSRNKAHTKNALWWNYYNKDEKDVNPNYTWVEGVWKKKSGSYVFCNRNGDTVDLDFTLKTSVAYDHLVMKIKWPYSYYVQNASVGSTHYGWYYYPQNEKADNFYEVNATGFPMYTTESVTSNTNRDIPSIMSYNRVRGAFNYSVTSFEISEETYSDFISGTKLSKNVLLSGDKTPADYLLSFAKLFGLYFYYDPTEEATNPTAAPNGVIHLMDRNTFFTEEVVNIEDKIDHSKVSTIVPTVAASKWLSFNTEQIDSEANNDYNQKYGYDYSRQLVNTSYNFDLGTTNLYDGNAFRGGVMVREKNNLYNVRPFEDSSYDPIMTGTLPEYTYNGGLKYKLFKKVNGEFEDKEYDIIRGSNTYFYAYGDSINNLGLKDYDAFPKLQCHTNDNSPSDGSGVLLFLNGSITLNRRYGMVDYYITDDIYDMATLNDGTPCYILTLTEYDKNGNRIARKINAIPNFTRDWIPGSQQEGFIVHSWNFGHPQETFVPNVYSTEGDCIYDKCWKSYIKDLYDVNTKTYTANVKLDDVNVGMLRKYYWFKNGLWRLNKIKDYNVNSYDTTQCEFIKVQDTDNYKLDQITAGGTFRLTLDEYSIGYNGGTIGGTVYIQGGGNWSRGDVVTITYLNGTTESKSSSSWISPATGSGQSSRLTVTVPANTSAYTRYITVAVEYETYRMTATITQAAPQASPYLAFNSSPVNINADGGSISAGFTKQNVRTGLTATSNVAWIYDIAVNESTNTVTASVSANTGYQRSGKITLNGTGINGTAVSAEVQIDQTSGGPAELSVQPDAINFDYLSTSGDTIYVSYGGSWTITEQDQ